jgi:hypothetical protein
LFLDKIEAKEYEYPYKVNEVPIQTSFFNHPVMSFSFEGSIDGHDQHHDIDNNT